jgi:hypothetical protein
MKQRTIFSLVVLTMLAAGTTAVAQQADEVSPKFLQNAHPLHSGVPARNHTNLDFSVQNNVGVPGIDSVVNFVKHFNANGVDASGNPENLWFYSMVGNPPERGGFTFISAPIVPVSLDLLNADGSVRYHYDVKPFILPTFLSPVFLPAEFSSSRLPTQYTDAVQRAEFFKVMDEDWHTLLVPEVKRGRTMAIPKGKYFFALNTDGTCCQFVLVDDPTFQSLLFPPTFPVDNSTVIGAAENAHDITTKDVSTFLFPNTYLYENGDPNQCCVLGFHSFDSEPGDAHNGNLPKAYIMNYSSWISPGLFGGGFQDITALSHEMAETFNDPFVLFDGIHNLTPWWLSGPQCQDVMEVGDVIEGLSSNIVFPIKSFGTTYHPQNVALLQWFEFQSPSAALGGAYSYPNASTLTALSPFEKVNCAP